MLLAAKKIFQLEISKVWANLDLNQRSTDKRSGIGIDICIATYVHKMVRSI